MLLAIGGPSPRSRHRRAARPAGTDPGGDATMTEIPPKSLAALVAAAGIATAVPDDEVPLRLAHMETRRGSTLPPISAGSWFRRRAVGSVPKQIQPEGPVA